MPAPLVDMNWDGTYLRSRMKPISRREVIKTFALGAAASNIIGNSWAASLLFDIRAFSHQTKGLLQIRLNEFPDLAQAGGSVRIGTSPVVRVSAQEIRQAGIFPPIIINRGAADVFHILSAECTHAGCSVQRMNAGVMSCPCHGSQFSINGSVRQGPAAQPLTKFVFSQDGEVLNIQMPDVFYEVKASRVASASRVEVSFLGFSNIEYELYFRANLSGPAQRVSFATTAGGPLDQTEIPGNDDFLKVWVERPGTFGFFQIAMKTAEV